MKRFPNSCVILGLIFLSIQLKAQQSAFNYSRTIGYSNEGWYAIVLPDDVFGKLESGYEEMRIIGINETGDTLEAPYLLNENREITERNEYQFKLVNESERQGKYYYTFDLSDYDGTVNRLTLGFDVPNFDWRVSLEGSQGQAEWYTVLKDYRIISIKNEMTDYTFTTLKFPDSQYKFLRVIIDGPVNKPKLVNSYFDYTIVKGGKTQPANIKKVDKRVDKKKKKSVIDIDLEKALPISKLKLDVDSDFDYYRSISISCITDSVETPAGWKYVSKSIERAVLSSLEENAFTFEPIITRKIKVIIENQDNPPLNVGEIAIERNVIELVTRITEAGSYKLYYGLKNASKPNYDIENFRDKIPGELGAIQLGEEMKIQQPSTQDKSLIKDKVWLWIAMLAVIGLLGWFTLKMLKHG